jgi:hypothetical protein
MIGRLRLAEEVQARLDKPSPDHVSVLGPALYGKSVLLQEIAARYAPGRPGYLTSVYVDLRRRTPANDHELRERVAGKLQTALEKPWPEGAELLKFEDVAVAERLQLVGQELAKTDDTVLLVLDGFDDVLPNPGITRKVWDNLLRIAALPVFRYITGSRKPLRELCRTEDSRTSDFWEIFHDVPVMVDCFNERDWAELLAPFDNQNTTLDAAARERLDEWTGSVPVLCLALLQSLWEAAEPDSELGAKEIDRVAERLLVRRRQILTALWEDCSAEMNTDLADLSRRQLRAREVPENRLHRLERRGFIGQEGKRLRFVCRLMERFAARESEGVSSLQRVFGDRELFEHNIRMFLEMRLSQVHVVDGTLHGYVEQAIRHLQPEPRHALVWIRTIVDRALDVIWERELKDGVTIPPHWLEEWERAEVRNPPDDGRGRVPAERGRQMRLLRYATGAGVSGRSLRRLTKKISKPTGLLLEHLQSVGNFGQHQDDEVNRPFVVSVCQPSRSAPA